MSFKPGLSALTGLALLISSSGYAASLFTSVPADKQFSGYSEMDRLTIGETSIKNALHALPDSATLVNRDGKITGISTLECQYSASSYIEEYYEEYRGYGEGDWKYRWNGSTIASGYDSSDHISAPESVNVGGYRYSIGQSKYYREGGPSRDDFWQIEKYQICRTSL